MPDPTERVQYALRREWLAGHPPPCWYLESHRIAAFFRDDNAGLELPSSWRKLLTLSNFDDEVTRSLPSNLRFNQNDFEELIRISNRIGFDFDFSSIEDDEYEDGEDAESSGQEGVKIDISGEILKRQRLEEDLRRRRGREVVGIAAALAAIGLTGLFAGSREFAARGALATEAQARREALSAERETRVAREESDSAKQRFETSEDQRKAGEKNLITARLENEGLRKEADRRIASQRESDAREAALKTKNRQLETRLAKSTPGPLDPGIPTPDFPRVWVAAGEPDSLSREPAFTAVRPGFKGFRWRLPDEEGERRYRVQVFEPGGTHNIGPIDLARGEDGEIANTLRLEPGRAYEWALVTAEGKTRLTRVPFYVLSIDQSRRLERALKSARSDAEKAAVLVRFKLFGDLADLSLEQRSRLARKKG